MDETDLFDYLLIGFALAVSLRMYRNVVLPDAQDQTADVSNETRQTSPASPTATPLDRTLERIRAACRYPTIQTFIDGAKRAYEQIATAFASGDLRATSHLLSPEVREIFESAIAARQAEGHVSAFTLIAFDEAEMVDAGIEARVSWIDVRFVTQAVSVVLDGDGRVVAGHPTEVARLTEIWTFERQLTGKGANWVLVATSTPDGVGQQEGAAHEHTAI